MHATCRSSATTAVSGGGAKAQVNAESSGLGTIGAPFPRVFPWTTEKKEMLQVGIQSAQASVEATESETEPVPRDNSQRRS